MTAITKVNIYVIDGRWYYSAWADDGHDHNGEVDNATSETESREWVAAQWPTAAVSRV